MLTSLALSAPFFVLTPAMGQDAPPSPTFEKPVDYHAWYNEFVSRGKKNNALELYESLAPNGNQMLDWKSNQWRRLSAGKRPKSSNAGGKGLPSPSDVVQKRLQEVFGKSWEPGAYPELARYLDECRPFLEVLKTAAKKKDFWQPVSPEIECLDFVALPYLSATRALSQAALAEATRNGRRQPDAIIDGARRVLRMSGHMQQGAMTLSTYVACEERNLANQFILAALAHGRLRAADAGRAASTLRKVEESAFGFSRAFTMEWAVALDLLQWVCPKGRVRSDHWKWLVRHMKEMNPREFAGYSPPETFDPRAAAAILNTRFEGLLKITKQPLGVRSLHELRQFDEQQHPLFQGHPFCQLLWAKLGTAYEIGLRTEVQRRATLLVLAMHDYHHRHGSWPGTLDALAVPKLKRIRIDPYCGRDFIYKVSDGKPVLYSVGPDEKDDGGRHDAKWGADGKDFVFWPVPPS